MKRAAAAPRSGRRRAREMVDVAIVGGGISGLSTAFYLTRAEPGLRIELLDRAQRVGGIVSTSECDGFLLEASADSFVRQKPEAMELARHAGLQDELVTTPPRHRRTWLWLDGGLRPFSPALLMRAPVDLEALISGDLLSRRGRLRALREPQARPSRLADESVAGFFQRRFGSEFRRRLVDPVVSGIYGGRTDKLSMRACFPSIFRLERRRGYVSGSSSESPKNAGFLSFRAGMDALAARLAGELERRGVRLQLKAEISKLQKGLDGFRLRASNGRVVTARFAVMAVDAGACASILRQFDDELAADLGRIAYSSAWIFQFGYRRRRFDLPPGTGLLAPAVKGRLLTAATWAHQKFPGRCPPDAALIRCFVSGEACEAGDADRLDAVSEQVQRELAEICGIEQSPDLIRQIRWEKALPQFECGHLKRIEAIRAKLQRRPGLWLVGNYIDGVGISDCVRHARKAATEICEAALGDV